MSGIVEDKADDELATAEHEAGLKAAKDFVNEIRVKCGLRKVGKLQKGYRGNQTLCPIAKSLESCGVIRVSACGDYVILFAHPKDGRSIPYHRPDIAQWMVDYDAGKYPELVIKPAPLKIKFGNERKARVVG